VEPLIFPNGRWSPPTPGDEAWLVAAAEPRHRLNGASSSHRPPVRVLYIAGHGRSGSTLLEQILAQGEGLVAVGELRHVWARGVREDQLCGCQLPFSSCSFWGGVLDRAFGAGSVPDAATVLALQARVDRTRFIPSMLLPLAHRRFREAQLRYVELYVRLLRGVQEHTGASTIVDSSKDPSLLYLLAACPDVDLRVLHLVRDARAVAHSWSQYKRRPEITGHTAWMPRYDPRRTALEWALRNLIIESARSLARAYRQIRYEDLLAAPRHVVGGVLEGLLGMEQVPAGLEDRVFRPLRRNHCVAGNPVRFRTGEVELSLDESWKTAMSPRTAWSVTAIAAPVLRRYGYPLRPPLDGPT
jgi:hypothetical protein